MAKSRRRAAPNPSWRNWARRAGLGFGLGLAAMSGAASAAAAEPADEDAVLFDTGPAVSQLGFTPGAEVFSIDERTPEIGEYTKNTETIDGLFRLYRFPRTGKLLMEIRVDQIGKDFLYFAQTVDGPLSAGHFRGAHRDAKIVRFVRQFDRIEIVEHNTQFYIDPASPLSRAAGANVTDSILTSMEIVAAAKDGKTVVVDVTRSFLTEELQQIKPSEDPYEIKGREFLLGDLSSTKTRYRTIRNYPANTDVAVAYVYDNPYPLNRGDEDITDPRSVTITLQHSFIALADSDYVPRRDDWRVGFFTNRITDLSSASFAPYRDVIERWNLKKKDPDAALSDPVKPILFWIENTTPVEFRDLIREAVLSWNTAFEAAGFTNALAVKIQPDDAAWDAGDIRYNVIRWMASPDPAFGGIGPRLADPRTGEIIASDIMLEYAFITNRIRQDKVFGTAALDGMIDEETGLLQLPFGLDGADTADEYACDFAADLQQQMMLGQIAQSVAATAEPDKQRLVEEGLRKLVVHEIGHALGLQHNMKASSVRSLADIQNPDKAAEGISGSVMDYTAVNLPFGEGELPYYQTKPGPYDIWAITFGYTPAAADPEAEAAQLEAIAARSTEPELAFGNDADDMRQPGRGIDPRVMVNDLSDDPAAWAMQRLSWADETMTKLKTRMAEEGESWQALRSAYLILTGEEARAAAVLSRQIGGVYVERANIGQPGAKTPFTPVPADKQRAAMTGLYTHVFAPNAFTLSEDLASHLQAQRRAYDFRRGGEDPKLHERTLAIQKTVLAHLLHPATLERLTDSAAYGNTYTAHAMLSDLTDAIFLADADGEVNSRRQNLQTLYTLQLIRMLKPKKPEKKNQRPIIYDPVSRAAALAQLRRIKDMAAAPWFNFDNLSDETLAHRAYLRQIILELMETEEE